MLFKYLPVARIDVLEKLKIRFSPPISFNDPFECQPLIDLQYERNQLLKEMECNLNKLWERTADEEKTEENLKALEEARAGVISIINEKTDSFLAGQKLMALLNDKIGILSLSRTEDNLLMWSHYADEGKGIIIGFDDEHSFFKQPTLDGKPTRPIPVVYTNKRSKVTPNEDRYYEKLLCEKPRDWAYEEEERLFRVFLSKGDSLGKDNHGMDIILTDLPKNTIKTIYLGYNISEEAKKKVLSAIKSNDVSCTIYQTSVSLSEYKIEFSEHSST